MTIKGAAELGLPEPEETGATFVGNAELKARAAADASGHAALADDSGLAVAALDGAPGIYSARWAGATRISASPWRGSKRELKAKGATDLSAKFVCALALRCAHGETREVFEGEVHGHLVFPPRGKHGFGYDPIFVADGMAETFGEIDPRKHAMSHRARAFEKLDSGSLRDRFRPNERVSASMCIGRSAPPNAPIAISTRHVRATIDESGWVDAIVRELEWSRERARRDGVRVVETIFFGGGTPSLMQRRSVGAHARHDRATVAVAPTMSRSRWKPIRPAPMRRAFADYRAAGVNRVSLGMQALERCRSEISRPPARCRRGQSRRWRMAMANFERVSLDLIYARPRPDAGGNGAPNWNEALIFGTDHLSLYQLTIEPETPFALLHRTARCKSPTKTSPPSLYETTQELTEAAGRPAYEISNHARPGAKCRHNLIYWRYGDYAGVGPGAHGRLIWAANASPRQRTSAGTLADKVWRKKATALRSRSRSNADGDAAREHLLMNLRLPEGLDLAAYELRWGSAPQMPSASPRLTQRDLVTMRGDDARRDAARASRAQQRDCGAAA